MFIATLFPEYDKAIYLDADLILVGDISELYNTNIEGKLVAAINDKLVSSVPHSQLMRIMQQESVLMNILILVCS